MFSVHPGFIPSRSALVEARRVAGQRCMRDVGGDVGMGDVVWLAIFLGMRVGCERGYRSTCVVLDFTVLREFPG